MKDLEPLSNDLVGLLDVERDIDDVAAPARARMRTRLESALPLLPPPPTDSPQRKETSQKPGDGTNPGSGLGSSALGTIKGKLLLPAIALLLGAAAGAGGHALTRPTAASVSPLASSLVVKVVLSSAPPDSSRPSAPVVDSAGVLIDLSNDASTTSSPSPSASANERGPRGAQHNAELLLLDAARTALTRGDYESALSALRRDARENPHGQLAEEREVMMVQALSASGDAAAAKQRAADFKQQFPDSLNRDTVDQLSPKTPNHF